MHKTRVFILAVLWATASVAAAPPPQPAQKGTIDAGHYKDTVRFLASDEMKGRGTGTPELEKAGAYLAGQFHKLGIPPAAGKSYFQHFSVTTNAKLGKGNRLEYEFGGASKFQPVALGQDFQPFNFSGNGKATATVVFVGYGITAPEYHYDDYEGVDVKGKIVLVLRHEPQEFDEKSIFAAKVYTTHAQLQSKAVNAKFHGALAVLFVNDLPNHVSDPDQVDKFSPFVGPNSPGIPFVQVKTSLAEGWLKRAGKSLTDWIAANDKDLKPQSFAIPELSVELSVDVERQQKQVANVCAYLAGETDEYVILGAHYDHLGMGDQNSMAPDQAGKAIHHGADDNASGTAGLMELADYFAGQPKRKRGILFIAFAAEELGLLGSSYYVNHPLLPLDKTVAMINLDMIGRIKDGRVFIGGSGTGNSFAALLDQVKPAYPLKLDLSDQGGYGSSDHFSFTTKQIPVLFFFSGLHSDYHRPSDTWEKIDSQSAKDLLRFIADVTTRLQSGAERPLFVKTAAPQPMGATGSSSGSGTWFGSVPDMGESKDGFKLADVTKGSPADEAGLKSGDIIVEFDGKPIANLMDFTYVLRSKKPGDTVEIKYKRDGKVAQTSATLKSRAQRR